MLSRAESEGLLSGFVDIDLALARSAISGVVRDLR